MTRSRWARARDIAFLPQYKIAIRCNVDRLLVRGSYLVVLAAALCERLVTQLMLLLQSAWRSAQSKAVKPES
jgi:hypothetical protein